MANRYTIRLNYQATYTATVEGDFRNDGDALDAVRKMAEDADPEEFVIGEEQASNILEIK
jgi:hypothetical protein